MERVCIVGSGPAGLMAAHQLAKRGKAVTVFDHKSAPARKFLVAGNGGFNLTHSEELELFLSRYDSLEMQNIVRRFTNRDTINWLQSIGIPTYVGSSGRVFPEKGIKPIQVLNNWLEALKGLKVDFQYNSYLEDFNGESLVFHTKDGVKQVPYQRAVFAFGGQSWSKTGSDGKWVALFEKKGISVKPLEPSNSGLEINIPILELAGKPIKNIRLFNELGERHGELVFTDYGIEGSAVYFMNRFIRQQSFPQTVYIDLKPNLSIERIHTLLVAGKTTEVLRTKLKFDTNKLLLIRTLKKSDFTNPSVLANRIKNFPVCVTRFRPIDEVISTYGGVRWTELDEDLYLHKYTGIQCCGEMLDWDAPTGGYLLQACFASGYHVANGC